MPVNKGSRKRRNQTKGSQSKQLPMWAYIALAAVGVAVIGFAAGLFVGDEGKASAGTTAKTGPQEITLAPESMLAGDSRVSAAPPLVREAYRFAIANPDVLDKMPCYCGCGGMGHKHNLACYVDRFEADGSPVFDYHALG